MGTLPKSECKEKNGNARSKKYTNHAKKAELLFIHMKQNMYLKKFRTTGLKQVNTEFKLYTIGHNLKIIYN